jgi:hypothetical protein
MVHPAEVNSFRKSESLVAAEMLQSPCPENCDVVEKPKRSAIVVGRTGTPPAAKLCPAELFSRSYKDSICPTIVWALCKSKLKPALTVELSVVSVEAGGVK